MAQIGLAVCLLLLAASPISLSARNCDALYYGEAQPKDFAKALACYRAQAIWEMVAIMQLNGEGTAVDVAGARATFKRSLGGQSFMDADAEALDAIIKLRETNPSAKRVDIDFCGDVAQTTPSLGYCQRREENLKLADAYGALKQIRARLDPGLRPAFDRSATSFRSFVKAEGERAYQKYIDGSIRNQFSMDQEALVRGNFMAAIQTLVSGTAGPPSGPRPLAEADKELNAIYREGLRSRASRLQPGVAVDVTRARSRPPTYA